MAISVVHTGTNQVLIMSSGTVALGSSATSGNDLILVVAWNNTQTISSVTDGQSNTYSLEHDTTASGGVGSVAIYRAHNITGGSITVTINFSGNVSADLTLIEASGVGTTADNAIESVGTGTATTFVSGLGTTVPSGDLAVAAVHVGTTKTFTDPSGYTVVYQPSFGTSSSVYRVCGASDNAPDWSWTGSTTLEGVLVLLPAAGGGGGPDNPPLHRLQQFQVRESHDRHWWQQRTRILAGTGVVTLDSPPTRQPSQRIDVKLDQNYRWWQQARLQPIPVTFLPSSNLLNPPRSQRVDVKPDQNYRWWQQKTLVPLPSSFVISGVGGYGLVNVIINSSGVGGYRIANDIAGYNVYIGEDDLPDLEAAPAAFTQTLPFNYALTPPLSGTRTFYVLVRNQDHYGLESQNQFYTTISINSNGDLLMSPIGNPSGLQLFELLLNKVRVMALYGAAQDDEFPATSWKIWAGTSPPDVDIDTPVLITAVTGKIMATEIGPFSPGLLYVTVALYRASDDSLSTPLEGSITLLDDPNEPTAVFSGFDLP